MMKMSERMNNGTSRTEQKIAIRRFAAVVVRDGDGIWVVVVVVVVVVVRYFDLKIDIPAWLGRT